MIEIGIGIKIKTRTGYQATRFAPRSLAYLDSPTLPPPWQDRQNRANERILDHALTFVLASPIVAFRSAKGHSLRGRRLDDPARLQS